VPAAFHAHAHLPALFVQIAVELLGFVDAAVAARLRRQSRYPQVRFAGSSGGSPVYSRCFARIRPTTALGPAPRNWRRVPNEKKERGSPRLSREKEN
jgi:hypothetical protein